MPRKKTNKKKSGKKQENNIIDTVFSKKFLFKSLFIVSAWAAVGVFLLIIYCAFNLPDVSKINENVRQPSMTIYDRNNKVIATMGDMYGDYTKFNEFPKTLIDAVVSTEDRRFFDHSGVDVMGIIRAFFVNSIAGHVVQGGSTITQQLAKIVYLSHERTFKRKIQELALALYLENKFTKEQIITMYLNRIYTGNGNYGMDAAAQAYFGKSVRQVNLYESAILAGLIKAPSRYSPANNPDLALSRAEQILINMVDNEVLKPSQLPKSGKLNYKFQPPRVRVQNKAPYFTDWIREQLPDYIGQYTSGYIEIYTTIDSRLQQKADETIVKSLAANGEKHHVTQGAMVVMSPDGEIIAMTGGKAYQESQFNRVTQALRQPGSAFKLFVYLAGLEQGYEPDSTMEDAPIRIKNWSPENYDNKYAGEVTLQDAFAKSLNTVAVRLAKNVGMKSISDVSARLGITSPINKDLSSALGTSEVTLLELTGAYAHLANYGNAVWTHGITKIKVNNNVEYERKKSGDSRVLSRDVTANMNSMLMSVVQTGTGRNAQLGFDVAGKTGTTQNLRDAWFIGFTSDYVAGVWMGNDDNTPMDKIAGGSFPALAWKSFIQTAESGKSPSSIPTDSSGVSDSQHNNGDGKDGLWDGIVNIFGAQKTAPQEAPVETQPATAAPWVEPKEETEAPIESQQGEVPATEAAPAQEAPVETPIEANPANDSLDDSPFAVQGDYPPANSGGD